MYGKEGLGRILPSGSCSKGKTAQLLDILDANDITLEDVRKYMKEFREAELRDERVETIERLAEKHVPEERGRARRDAEMLTRGMRSLSDKGVADRMKFIRDNLPRRHWKLMGGPDGLEVRFHAIRDIAKATRFADDDSLQIDKDKLPRLIAGACQSGKSAIRNAIILIMDGFGFYNVFILSCGRNDSAREMQKQRAGQYLPGIVQVLGTPDNDVTLSTARMCAEELEDNLHYGLSTLVVSKSNGTTLRALAQLAEIVTDANPECKILVMSDEGDEAHVALKHKQRVRYDRGVCAAFRNLVQKAGGGLIWFTATPMPLLGMDRSWEIYPRGVTVTRPVVGSGYYDNTALLSPRIREHVIDPWLIDTLPLPDSIDPDGGLSQFAGCPWVMDTVLHHVSAVSSIFPDPTVRPPANAGGSICSLVNPGLEHENHNTTKAALNFVKRRLFSILEYRLDTGRWPGAEGKLVKRWIAKIRYRLRDSHKAHNVPYVKPSLESLRDAILDTSIVVHNMNQGGPWREFRDNEIVIAGLKAARGVSTAGLVGFTMPWLPKKMAHDTILQRGRYQGYRDKEIHLFRVSILRAALPEIEMMAVSEESLTASLERYDRTDVDLRSIDVSYITAPGHEPCNAARQSELQNEGSMISPVSKVLRLNQVRYDRETGSIVVDQRDAAHLARVLRLLGDPDEVHDEGHLTWHNVPSQLLRDLISLTSDLGRVEKALGAEEALDRVNVTLYHGQKVWPSNAPIQLRGLHLGYRKARVIRRQMEVFGDYVRPLALESSHSNKYNSDGSLTKVHDLALDRIGDVKNGQRGIGEPGHLVLYPTELTRDSASTRGARVVPGGIAILGALAMPEGTLGRAHMSEWTNSSEPVVS